jgi:hypothetical protein
MTRLVCVAATGILLTSVAIYLSAEESAKQQDSPKKTLVAQKLDAAQKLLAAVASNDNSEVEKQAQELIRISKDLEWKKYRTERYEELGKEYRHELESLIKATKTKNNQAMALGYVKTSLACFNCHDHVREVKIADK